MLVILHLEINIKVFVHYIYFQEVYCTRMQCQAGGLETVNFLFIAISCPTNATAWQILKHTWVVQQRIPWFVLHANNVRERKNTVREFSLMRAHTYTHLRGLCCIRALQNAHTESVPHLHRFKLPSGPIWRIWPPEKHTNTPHLWNSKLTCSCMYAKTTCMCTRTV